MSLQTSVQPGSLKAKLAELTKPAGEIDEALLASASYDGDTRRAILKFYDQKAGRFWLWEDNTGHRPYCLTRLPMGELEGIRARKDVVEIREEERLDLLNDTTAKVRKVVTTDPLAVGGGNDSIRDAIRAWEADIKYYENYTYDLGLRMGTYYRVTGGKVVPVKHEVPERVNRSLEEVTRRNPEEFQPYLKEWAELLSEPLADFRRVAMDIEVANEAGRLPDTDDPKQPVIAVSFVGAEEKLVYLLRAGKDLQGLEGNGFAYEVFDEEEDLLRVVMSKILDYPVLVTFNGDDFDLRYLQHRAERLGIAEEEDPIQLERVAASLKHGIHVDLYQFFRNRSIQVYAFGNKYAEHTLNGISEALLNRSKLEFDGEIGDLPLAELAKYCLNDSQLTYDLTALSGSVVMKLLLVISRIGKMPMNDVSRLGVSNWIRSMLFFEHRRLGALIPRQDELAEKGGGTTQAVIKGKKYKGGFVIEPKPGVYFDVAVLDFASLYPSLIKVHNLSYETVNCPHPECRANKVPDTTSWVCTRRKGIVSLVTGSLRDLRVAHYKPLTRDRTLPTEDRELYNVVTQGLKVFLNACFTGDTYVITPQGVRNIKEMRVGDEVVNVNPQTLRAEVDKVVEVQVYRFEGDLLHFKDKRFVDLLVTPNHRMLTADRRKSSLTGTSFRTAEEVCGLTNMAIPKLKGGVEDRVPPRRVSLLDAAKQVGASAYLYPKQGSRLADWLRTLPFEQRRKIREYGEACRRRSKRGRGVEPHYRVPAGYLTEADLDAFEGAGGRALVGEKSSKIPARFDSAPFASLCGWFVSEESRQAAEAEYANGESGGRASSVVVSQSFGRGDQRGIVFRGEVGQLLERLGLSYIHDGPDDRRFEVTSPVLHRWMLSHCYDGRSEGHGASDKAIPKFVFESRTAMESFLDPVCKGDGNSRGIRYSTTSVRLAEGLLVLTTMLGAKAKMNFDGGVYRVVSKNVSSRLTSAGREKGKHVEKVPYEGVVYCVTTQKNHTVIAGRNGRFAHVGQSYGVLGFETFAFYCLPVAEATAALGRDAITRTIAKCNELGVKVLYGDTDSTYLQNPSKDQIDTVTRWTQNELGIELDLDKVYRYVAFSSRKKNYFGVLPDGTVDIKGLTGKKSVDGATPMLARFDERVQLVTVKDVFRAFRQGKSVEVLTVVDDLSTAWVRISDAMQHSVGDVYRVVTSKGRNLVLSGDHSVYLMDTFGQLRCKDTRSLKTGDVVVGAQYIPPRNPSRILPVLHYLVSPLTLRGGMAFSGKTHATVSAPIPSKLPMCEELATLLGVYVAEGNTSKVPGSRNNFITQSQRVNPEVCSAIESSWKTLFQTPVKVYRRGGGINSYYLPKLHAEFFEQLCGGSSSAKHVPGIVHDADNRFVAAFLRAAFSGDGYGDGKRVNIASKSRALAIGLAYLLARFDIDTRIRRMRVKGSTYYQLSIIGAFSRSQFYARIGFMQPRFNRKVKLGAKNKELLPLKTDGLLCVKEEMMRRRGVTKMKGVKMHDSRYYNLSVLDRYNSVLGTLMQIADQGERARLAR
ncbi:MAG: ribonuclease H-like domain-containing protein, partial [Nitrososphaerota archaeon]|nr:ribonuclease H-like domain-containing protein [Nitrososphaerota archaeon]